MSDVALNLERRESTTQISGNFTDNVIPTLLAWRKQQRPASLVTLVGIEGSSPRPIGSQMAVTGDGQYVGQISSGCAERAIVEQACELVRDGRDACLRYGNGSKFLDVVLPCGSGIDVLFATSVATTVLEEIDATVSARQQIDLRIDLTTHEHATAAMTPEVPSAPRLATKATTTPTHLIKSFSPRIRVLIFGRGPIIATTVGFARALDLETHVYAPDNESLTLATNTGATQVTRLTTPHSIPKFQTDPWTSGVLLFHDHEWEPPILKALCETSCFYLGALGSKTTHAARLKALRDMGCKEPDLIRIDGPAGIDIGAQTPPEIALSVIAEIVLRIRTGSPPDTR